MDIVIVGTGRMSSLLSSSFPCPPCLPCPCPPGPWGSSLSSLSFLSSLSPLPSFSSFLSKHFKNLSRCAIEWTRIVEWHNCDCCRGGQVSNGCFCTSSVSTYRYARQTWRPTMDFGTEVVCYAGWQMLSVSCAPGVWNVASEGAAQDRWQICDSLWEDPKQTSGKPTNK